MSSQQCVAEAELRNYSLGLLDDESSEQIEQHLRECSRCDNAVATFDDSSDSLMRSMRLRPSDVDEPAWVEPLATNPDPGSLSDATLPAGREPAGFDPLLIADYRLQRVIGRGGMSVVFSARHERLGRHVAFKVLKQPTTARRTTIDRFCREMRSVGSLTHPAIVQATDAGEFDGVHYLVMEQVDGIDLSRLLYTVGTVRVADACRIAYDIADALSYAHDAGIIHRDIKPSNVMLDRFGQVKLLDFGLARLTGTAGEVTECTTVGQLLGTLDYMAPEQANGEAVDARADLYSLGATLFRLLTGRPPYGRSSEVPLLEFVRRLVTEPAPSLAEQRTDVPEELSRLISRTLAAEPGNRIESASAFRDALEPFTSGADLRLLASESLANPEAELSAADGPPDDLQRTVAELFPHRVSRPEPRPDKHRRSGWLKLLAPLVLIGLTIWSVVVLVQTPEGTVRIESEVDDVRVELVAEDETVTRLRVNRSGMETEVLAGRYRVRIGREMDGLDVSPDSIVVRKNADAFARITKQPAAVGTTANSRPNEAASTEPSSVQDAAARQALSLRMELRTAQQLHGDDHETVKSLRARLQAAERAATGTPTEPVSKGRTLSHWAAMVEFETSQSDRLAAAVSVLELIDTAPPEQKGELLVKCLDADLRLNGERVIDSLVTNRIDRDGFLVAVQKQFGQTSSPGDAARELDRYLQDEKLRDAALATLATLAPHGQFDADVWRQPLATAESARADLSPQMALCLGLILPPDRAAAALTTLQDDLNDSADAEFFEQIIESRQLPVDAAVRFHVAGRFQEYRVQLQALLRKVQPDAGSSNRTKRTPLISAFLKPFLVRMGGQLQQGFFPRRRFEVLVSLIDDGYVESVIRQDIVQLLDRLLAFQRNHGTGYTDDEIERVTMTMRSYALLTGRLPVLARLPFGSEMPPELKSLSRAVPPRSTAFIDAKWAAALYPVDYVEAAEKYYGPQPFANNTVWIENVDPVIALAIIGTGDGRLPHADSSFGTHVSGLVQATDGLGEKSFRNQVLHAIERHATMRRLFDRWFQSCLKRDAALAAWSIFWQLGPDEHNIDILQTLLADNELRGSAAGMVAGSISFWVESGQLPMEKAVALSKGVEQLPAGYFPYVAKLFDNALGKHGCGLAMAIRYLDVASTDHTQLAVKRSDMEGEADPKSLNWGILRALRLLKDHGRPSEPLTRLLPKLRTSIRQGALRSITDVNDSDHDSDEFGAFGQQDVSTFREQMLQLIDEITGKLDAKTPAGGTAP